MTTPLDLPPIGLAELTERAALMTRTDRKYLVPTTTARRLLRALQPDLRVLDIDGQRAFRYRSTYLDTEDLEAYRGAATGRRRRYKVRRRDYLDTGTAYLEVKTRTGRGASSKTRIVLDDATLPAAARGFIEGTLREAGCTPPASPLRPVLCTEYDRTTLLVGSEGSRLTLDAELRWLDPGTAAPLAARRSMDDLLVVETKGGTRPGAADRYLWSIGHRPVRLSKYGTGLALLRPEIGAHRWHRTLTTMRAAA